MTINQRFVEIIKKYGSRLPEDGFFVDFLVGGVKGNVVRTTVVGQGYVDENLLALIGQFKAGEIDVPIVSNCADDKGLIELLSEQDKKGLLRDPIIEIQGPFPDSNKFHAVLYTSNRRSVKYKPYPLLT